MKNFVVILFLFFALTQAYSQKEIHIKILEKKADKAVLQEKIKSTDKFTIKEIIPEFIIQKKLTKEGLFGTISVDGMQKTYTAGSPDLPVYGKLIEIPANYTVNLVVKNFKEKQISLADYDISEKLIPAQESMSKSDDPEKVPFKINKDIYNSNSFYKNEFVHFEDRGYLRNKHLGFIQISPFEYNPVTNTIIVKYDFEIEVEFISDNKSKIEIDNRLKSFYFENLPLQTINEIPVSKALIQGPVKYVIVSDPMFEAALQPFIEWKRMKGFKVVTAYTNNPAVGTTATSIKAYLKGLYDSPVDGVSPTFVLLVGDVAQIPASSSSSHYTDLYYFEYTGDRLPEVFGGRFSATSVAQLQPQIDKSLQVEKYLMPNKSYLNNVVVIAGADATYAPTWGNGFVNYANTYYTNAANGINSLSYLYPASASADEQIKTNISTGVSLANYTAHCSSDGWSDPTFGIGDVALMTNANKYPLMIGNCCESLKFGGNCFGEELLRAANKGAVGYIGASNLTYWDEDYFWAIGVAPITANPTYAGSGLGAYDRFFHLNGEPKENWFITQAQINVAGNLAVEASGSTRKTYYWEIYHLLGDPSLVPFVKVPTALTSTFNSEIIIGSSTFEISTEENAYAALSFNEVLLDAKVAGTDGLIQLNFNALTEVGTATLVITKQNRIPVIQQIQIIPSTTPYVIKNQIEINDELGDNNGALDYGETIKFDVQLKNISKAFDALSVKARLIISDTNIILVDSIENYGTILRDTVSLKENAFQFKIKNTIPDQHLLQFIIEVSGADSALNNYTWNSKANYFVNAPKLKISDLIIDDSGNNGNGILDPGETATLKWIVSNTGHDSISELNGLIEYVSGSTLATINNSSTNKFSIAPGATDTIKFSVTVSELEQKETPVIFKISVIDNQFNFFTESINELITIGEVPVYKISDGGKHIIYDSALFYDSGGSDLNYKDYENYTIRFVPFEGKGFLKVKFNSFVIEEKTAGGCWDYLTIYNDTTTSLANKVGDFCTNNPATEFTATNTSGALTFKFYSDELYVRSGWVAEISIVRSYNVTFKIVSSGKLIENALVKFNSQEKYTNAQGEVVFEDVNGGTNLLYEIKKTGYDKATGSFSVSGNITKEIELIPITYYNVKFIVTNGIDPISEATILFNTQVGQTDLNGEFVFDSIEYALNKKFTITRDKYIQYIDSIDVDTNITVNVSLKLELYSVTFQVSSSVNSGPLEGVNINFNAIDQLTNVYGTTTFNEVEPKSGIQYILTKTGFMNLIGNLDVSHENKNIALTMSVISAIDDLTKESISIYPNPSQGIINIDLTQSKPGNAHIEVLNILGKTVLNKNIPITENTKEIIDLTNQAKGIYFITINTSAGERFSRKIVLK